MTTVTLPRRIAGRTGRLLFHRLPTLLAASFAEAFRHRVSPLGVRRILLVRLDGLGDCVLTLPALASLRRCFPSATLTVVAQESTAPLFASTSSIDDVLSLPARGTSRWHEAFWQATQLFWQSLRRPHFDIAINPRWDGDLSYATYLCALTRAPVSVGYEDATTPSKLELSSGFERSYTLRLPAGPLQHEVQRNLDVVRALGCSVVEPTPHLLTTPQSRDEARRWLGPRPQGALFLALGLPAAAPKRRWDAPHYIAVLDRLKGAGEIVPILFADAETLAVAQEIEASYPQARIATGLSLPEVQALLAECDLFLGSDSGLAHVAAAVGCRTVTISPHPRDADRSHENSPDRFRPVGERSIVVQPTASRPGCEAGCESPAAHCILDIGVEDVADAVRALLTGPKAS